MGLCFYGLFDPPEGLDTQGLFVWLTAFSIGVRLFLTFYAVPSNALGPEMTSSYDERTSLVSFRWSLGWLGSASVTALGWFWFLRDPGEGIEGRLIASNYPAIGAYCGLLVAAAILISSLGTHRLIPSLRSPAREGPLFSPAKFASEVANALGNRSYRMLIAGQLFTATALGIQEVLGTYMNTYFWEFRSNQLGTLAVLTVIPVLIGVALVLPVSRRLDKRRAAISLALFASSFGPAVIVARFLDWLPPNGSPVLFWIVALHGGTIVIAAIQIGILYSSMVMDSADESALKSGLRQEGVFVSAISFTGKAVSGLGNFLGGVILDLIRFPRGAGNIGVEDVPGEQIMLLGLIAGPGLMFFHLANVFFLTQYRVDRARYGEIVDGLAEREDREGGASS
jgi:Na+/melibiose symporter-like transporter